MSLRNLINLLYTRAPLVNKALGTAFRVDERLVNVLRDDANVLTMERFFETVTNVENAIGKAVDGLISVSYTHLDVYKRQDEGVHQFQKRHEQGRLHL